MAKMGYTELEIAKIVRQEVYLNDLFSDSDIPVNIITEYHRRRNEYLNNQYSLPKDLKQIVEADFSLHQKLYLLMTIKEVLTFIDNGESYVVDDFIGKIMDKEIDKIQPVNSINKELSSSDKALPVFCFTNKKGARIDLIRILHTIYELRLIEYPDGQIPPKYEFMEKMGEFLSINLTSYDTDLSQSLQSTAIGPNLKIFEKMIEVIKKGHYTYKNK